MNIFPQSKEYVDHILRRIKANWKILLLFAVAFFVRFFGMWPGFQDHPDESAVVAPVFKMIENLDPNPHSFIYGSLYYYIQAFLFLILGIFLYTKDEFVIGVLTNLSSPQVMSLSKFFSMDNLISSHGTILYFSGRLLTVLLSTATVYLVYRICVNFFNKKVAFLAAIILTVTPLHVRDAKFITMDSPQTFIATLAFYFICRIFWNGRTRDYLISGFLLGVFFSFKYYPFLFPLIILVHFLSIKNHKSFYKNLISGLLIIPFGFLLSSPAILFDQTEFINQVEFVTTRYAPSLHIGGDFISFSASQWFYPSFLFWKGLTPVLTIFALVGLLSGLFKEFRKVLLVSFPFIAILYFFTFKTQSAYERAIQPALPFAAILSGLGMYYLSRILSTKHAPKIAIVLLLVAITYPTFSIVRAGWYCSKETTIVTSRLWINDNISENSRIIYNPGVRFPSKEFILKEITINGPFSLSETADFSPEYAIIHHGYLGPMLHWGETDFFIYPKDIVSETFIKLAEKEYENNSEFKINFSKPEGCWDHDLTVYKLKPFNKTRKSVERSAFLKFNPVQIQDWSRFDLTNKALYSVELSSAQDFVEINPVSITYTGPSIRSDYFPIDPSKQYDFSANIQIPVQSLQKYRSLFFRINLYDRDKKIVSFALTPRAGPETDWQTLKTDFKTGDDVVYGQIYLTLLPEVNNQNIMVKSINVEKY